MEESWGDQTTGIDQNMWEGSEREDAHQEAWGQSTAETEQNWWEHDEKAVAHEEAWGHGAAGTEQNWWEHDEGAGAHEEAWGHSGAETEQNWWEYDENSAHEENTEVAWRQCDGCGAFVVEGAAGECLGEFAAYWYCVSCWGVWIAEHGPSDPGPPQTPQQPTEELRPSDPGPFQTPQQPEEELRPVPPFNRLKYTYDTSTGWWMHLSRNWFFSEDLQLYLHAEDATVVWQDPSCPDRFMRGGPAQIWRVIGGDHLGGIVVRAGKELESSREPQRLSTGALLLELARTEGRLEYARLTGTGPLRGWVSVQLYGRPLLAAATVMDVGHRDVCGGRGHGRQVSLKVTEAFEEALELVWSVMEDTTGRSSRPCTDLMFAVIEMVLDHEDADARAARARGKSTPAPQPKQGSLVKRVEAGYDRDAMIHNMPEGRNFLVSVLLDVHGQGRLRSEWVCASTLRLKGRPFHVTSLDPGGRHRGRGLGCRCDGFVVASRKLLARTSADSVRCRRCGCDYDLHELALSAPPGTLISVEQEGRPESYDPDEAERQMDSADELEEAILRGPGLGPQTLVPLKDPKNDGVQPEDGKDGEEEDDDFQAWRTEPPPPTVHMTLARLAELCGSMMSAGFEFLVIGGWAVDICLGRQSRPHRDVDMCIRPAERDRFETFLESECGCLRVERDTVEDGTCKTTFYLPNGAYGEAMGVRDDGENYVLEGRQWMTVAPKRALGSPFSKKSIEGLDFPIGCVELMVKMQQKWGYCIEDVPRVKEMAKSCREDVLKSILCWPKCQKLEGNEKKLLKCRARTRLGDYTGKQRLFAQASRLDDKSATPIEAAQVSSHQNQSVV